jgi:hypothetical protein
MKFATALTLSLLTLSTAAPSAFAQYGGGYDRGPQGRGDSGGLPGGSWVATCRRPQMNGPTLMAQCQDARGRERDSSIDIRSCATANVANRDGGLVCESAPGRGNGLPAGSWTYTCRGGQMQGPIVNAECRDGGGRWRGSSIDIRTCASNRLANRDGGLICE